MTIGPMRRGSMGNTGGSKTRVSVPHANSTMPLKKKLRPTVTMITVSTGSTDELVEEHPFGEDPQDEPDDQGKGQGQQEGHPHGVKGQ